jgi:hypothetical protein
MLASDKAFFPKNSWLAFWLTFIYYFTALKKSEEIKYSVNPIIHKQFESNLYSRRYTGILEFS